MLDQGLEAESVTADPTAQAFVGDSAVTPARLTWLGAPGTAGDGTVLHAKPSQCSISATVAALAGSSRLPTAQASVLDVAATAASADDEPGPGLGTTCQP
jgi:hypothetical protein